MNEVTKKSIRTQILEQINATGTSQRQYSRKLGISDAQLSNIVNEKWEMISEQMLNRISAQLNGDAGGWPIIRTSNFATIHQACEDARLNRRMLGIAAPTGYGKTKALQAYSSSTPAVGYVLCDFLMTQKAFLTAVARAFGLDSTGTKLSLMESITRRMNEANDSLLILDDLGKVNDRIYRIIQLFYDRTEGAAGIVVAGVPYLQKYIEQSANRDKMGFRELKSRIEYWQDLDGPRGNEVQVLCESNGITDPDCIKYIKRQSPDFRTLRALILNAVSMAAGHEVDLELLETIKVSRIS